VRHTGRVQVRERRSSRGTGAVAKYDVVAVVGVRGGSRGDDRSRAWWNFTTSVAKGGRGGYCRVRRPGGLLQRIVLRASTSVPPGGAAQAI
jgi:hypothetical protein